MDIKQLEAQSYACGLGSHERIDSIVAYSYSLPKAFVSNKAQSYNKSHADCH
jgi:hypothetical protein